MSIPYPKVIAEALDLHDRYVEALDSWHGWLQKESNAGKLVLFKLIEDLIIRRKLSPDSPNLNMLPSGNQMRAWTSSDRWENFKEEIKKYLELSPRRTPESLREKRKQAVNIEDTARNLVSHLESKSFLEKWEEQTIDERIKLRVLLTKDLASSRYGLLYLNRSIKDYLHNVLDPTFPISMHSSQRIEDEINYFIQLYPNVRRGMKVAINYFLYVITAITPENEEIFIRTLSIWISLYYPTGNLPGLNLRSFEVFLKLTQEFHADPRNENYLKELGTPVLRSLSVLLDMGAAYVAIKRLEQSPDDSEEKWNALKYISRVAAAGDDLIASIALNWPTKRLPSRYSIVSIVTNFVDATLKVIDSYEQWDGADYDAALGEYAQGVGYALPVIMAGWKALASAGIVTPVNPLVGAGIALAGVMLVFGGSLWVMLTDDTKIEEWFKKNYFGIAWDTGVATDESPESLAFRWKFDDDTPNIERQISEYFSMMFFPVGLEEPTIVQNGLAYRVDVSPLITHEGGGRTGWVSWDSPLLIYELHPWEGMWVGRVHVRSFDPAKDLDLETGQSLNARRIPDGPGWIKPRNWSDDIFISFVDGVPSWIEVAIPPPGDFVSSILDKSVPLSPNEVVQIKNVMGQWPFLVRERKKMKR